MQYEDLTKKIIAACYDVNRELGCGFLESVYQNALAIALQQRELALEREYALPVSFRGQTIGQFYADFLVENVIILELKALPAITESHQAQIINYLKASGLEVGLLVNFGARPLQFRRFDNRFIRDKDTQPCLPPLVPSSNS